MSVATNFGWLQPTNAASHPATHKQMACFILSHRTQIREKRSQKHDSHKTFYPPLRGRVNRDPE
jgi:hypothetical protein